MITEGSWPCSQQPVTCPYRELNQFNTRICNRFILIFIQMVHSHLPIGLLGAAFPSVSTPCTSPPLLICHMSRPSHSSWFAHPSNIWWRVRIMKRLTVQFSSVPCYLFPLWSKHLPQHQPLKHPQPILMLSLVFICKEREYHYFCHVRLSRLS